jgi:hypothetical protein
VSSQQFSFKAINSDDFRDVVLSVVAVYKEEGVILEFVRRVSVILEALVRRYEIIFYLDPSPDQAEHVIMLLLSNALFATGVLAADAMVMPNFVIGRKVFWLPVMIPN